MAIEERVRITVSEKGVDKTERKIKGLGKTARTASKAVAGIAVALGAVVAVRGLARLATEAVRASAAFEGYGVQLKALLGNQEDANKALETFVALSSSTPFGVAQIAQGATVLAAAAQGSREELEELVKISTNIAGVTGLTFQQTAENLARALNSGIGAADLFREKGIRKLIEDNTELTDATKATAEELRAAFDQVFSETGKFGNAAKELSLTLGGSLSNVSDAATNFKVALGDALAPTIINTANQVFIPFFNLLEQTVKGNEAAISNFVAGGVNFLIDAFLNVAITGAQMLKGINAIKVFFDALVGTFLEASLSAAKFEAQIKNLGAVIGVFSREEAFAAQEEVKKLSARIDENAESHRELVIEAEKSAAALSLFQTQARALQDSTTTESIGTRFEVQPDAAPVVEDISVAEGLTTEELEKQADARTRLIDLAEAQVLAGLKENDIVAFKLAEIDKEIAAAVELQRISGERALGEQVINDLIAQRAAIVEEGTGPSELATAFSTSISDGFSDGIANAVRNGGNVFDAIGDSFEQQAQESLIAGFEQGFDALQKGLEGAFDAVADSLDETFGPAFEGMGDVMGGILGGVLQFVALQALSALFGGGGNSSSSSAVGVQSAVTSTEAVRGIVAGPQEIAIAQVDRAIGDAMEPATEELRAQTSLLRSILDSLAVGATGEGTTADTLSLAAGGAPLATS